ncbi:centrosomal protein of 63 kDa-like isoform X2 [Ptychodera flava]|uniref:centrosomal protein of 63 kDa-like isoform X2 n=1 Tax=Ptychodera flava TaxID=63121 RepID=UPI003969DE70
MMMTDFHKQAQEAGLFQGSLSSCEAELQELMRQIDIMVNNKKLEWDMQLQDNKTKLDIRDKEVISLRATIESKNQEEFRLKLGECESQKRSLQQQISVVESQNKTVLEKCDLLQQQALGYQEQLSKRRQLLEKTEINFRTQQSQLEGQLARAQETVEHKESMLKKLKTSVEETLTSNKQLTEEHNRLIEDLQNAQRKNLKLEDELGQIQLELQSRDDLLKIADQEQRQHGKDLSHFEERIRIKDNMIRALEQGKQQDRDIEIDQLRKQLSDADTNIRVLSKNEQRLQEENSKLQIKIDDLQRECTDLNMELAKKIDEIRRIETTEVKKLNVEVNKSRDKYYSQEMYYNSEMDKMRSEISTLTSELQMRDVTVATLSNDVSAMERKLREVSDNDDRLNNELQVTVAQLDALRVENKHLRETTVNEKLANTKDLHEIEAKLNELQQLQVDSNKTIVKLENEGSRLRQENAGLRQDLSSLKHQYNAALQETQHTITNIKVKDDRKIQEIEDNFEKRLQNEMSRFESTLSRYKGEIKSLHQGNTKLETVIKHQADSLKRLEGEHGIMTNFISAVDHITSTSPGRSSVHSRSSYSRSPSKHQDDSLNTTQEPLELPSLLPTPEKYEYERPSSRASVTASFVSEERRRGKELEHLLDDHIADLHKNTEITLRKFTSIR